MELVIEEWYVTSDFCKIVVLIREYLMMQLVMTKKKKS